MTSQQSATRSAKSWVRSYRDSPSLFLLNLVVSSLQSSDEGPVELEQVGISSEWLADQGRHVCVMKREDAERFGTFGLGVLKELAGLRRALFKMGVDTLGWAISPAQEEALFVEHARHLLVEAFAEDGLFRGYTVFKLWVRGYLPNFKDLQDLYPNAKEIATTLAARYIRRELRSRDEHDREFILTQLRKLVLHLDVATRTEFAKFGIPTDEEQIKHSEKVIHARGFWRRFLNGDDSDSLILAFACRDVLAKKAVTAREIGTTKRDMWAVARAWVESTVGQIEAGEYEAFSDLDQFVRWSELGYEPFDITEEQAATWELAQARDRWAHALLGDGKAAFKVVCYCNDPGNSYEAITGLSAAESQRRLQKIMDEFAGNLLLQIQVAPHREWAYAAFAKLRDFVGIVRELNEHWAKWHEGAVLVDDSRWQFPDDEWHGLYIKYARTER